MMCLYQWVEFASSCLGKSQKEDVGKTLQMCAVQCWFCRSVISMSIPTGILKLGKEFFWRWDVSAYVWNQGLQVFHLLFSFQAVVKDGCGSWENANMNRPVQFCVAVGHIDCIYWKGGPSLSRVVAQYCQCIGYQPGKNCENHQATKLPETPSFEP